jgi:hypothetical protein
MHIAALAAGPDDDEYTGELLPYITGEKNAPLPTYFVGGWGHGSKQALEALAASDGNVRYLGRSGVASVSGLQVAFLDGCYNAAAFRATEATGTSSFGPGCRYYAESGGRQQPLAARPHRRCWACQPGVLGCAAGAEGARDAGAHAVPLYRISRSPADVDRLKLALAKAEGDVDVLLTCEWPAGVCDDLPEAARPQGVALDGAVMCAEVALACRPRYHVAAGGCCRPSAPPFAHAVLCRHPAVRA